MRVLLWYRIYSVISFLHSPENIRSIVRSQSTLILTYPIALTLAWCFLWPANDIHSDVSFCETFMAHGIKLCVLLIYCQSYTTTNRTPIV